MTPATLTISAAERDMLHELMLRRLFVLGDDPVALARAEGISSDRLAEEFGEDLRLMRDLGWIGEGEGEGVELTLPADQLSATLRRLRRDARRAPCEQRHEREPQETDEERWRRFRDAVAVCDELLARLDPWDQSKDELSRQRKSDSEEPYKAVSDGLILAAVERAVSRRGPRAIGGRPRGGRGRRAARVAPAPHLAAGTDRSRRADRRVQGRSDRRHRAGRRADRPARPVMSREWLELSERLRLSSWRLASATYCLTEWMEPEDERPDVDENPGPHPGRRAISAWDDPPRSREGS